jgi:hypothetical protein
MLIFFLNTTYIYIKIPEQYDYIQYIIDVLKIITWLCVNGLYSAEE